MAIRKTHKANTISEVLAFIEQCRKQGIICHNYSGSTMNYTIEYFVFI